MDTEMADVDAELRSSPPQRSPGPRDSGHVLEPLDKLLQDTTIPNFSRKRDFSNSTPRNSYDSGSHTAKRQRSARWDRESPGPQEPSASPERASKFQEGSMNDRPSDEPPSLFTRYSDKTVMISTEALMEDYHKDNNKPLPPYPSSKTLPRAFGSKVVASKGSESNGGQAREGARSATSQQNSSIGDDQSSGGIFKFGRSMASAFNPLNIFSRFTGGWRAAREEETEEVQDDHTKALHDQKRRAEEAYAVFKQTGQLGALGSHALPAGAVHAPGYTKPVTEAVDGDSLTTEKDVVTGTVRKIKAPSANPTESTRKRRTPSLQNLKRIASDINMHRRSTSNLKAEKGDVPPVPTLTKSRSTIFNIFSGDGKKGDSEGRDSSENAHAGAEVDDSKALQPTTWNARTIKKLGKDTQDKKAGRDHEDLEARAQEVEKKLDIARHKLNNVGTPRSFRRRAPALPTLLSESLLIQQNSAGFDEASTEAGGLAAADTAMQIDEPTVSSPSQVASNGLSTLENQPLDAAQTTTNGNTIKRKPLPTSSPEEPKTFLADPSSPTESPNKQTEVTPKDKKKKRKKKSMKDNKNYRPSVDSDDDAEWADAASKTKKRRKSGDSIKSNSKDSPKHSQSRKRTSNDNKTEAKAKKNTLTKAAPLSIQKVLPPTPVAEEALSLPSSPTKYESQELETVFEETSFSSVIPLKKGSPRHPTAKATPAVPHYKPIDGSSSPSRSPRRPRVLLQKQSTPKRNRDVRSGSPPPSSNIGRSPSRSPPSRHGDPVKMARPNGRDVPPMPRQSVREKESFEWPDDVF